MASTAKDGIVLQRHAELQILHHTSKGRGVFATGDIPQGTVIDVSPVLILPPAENEKHIRHTELHHYTYNWPYRDPLTGKISKTQAVILGLGSMFNHSSRDQNVGWLRDIQGQVITYTALRHIRRGEELSISYGWPLTFKDVDADGAEPYDDSCNIIQDIDQSICS